MLHRSINLVSAGVGGQNRVKNKTGRQANGLRSAREARTEVQNPLGPLARGALARTGSFSQLSELLP